jgi:hypothetical protein
MGELQTYTKGEILMLVLSRKDAIAMCEGVAYKNAKGWEKDRMMRKLRELALEEDFSEVDVDETIVKDVEERTRLNSLLVALRASQGDFKLTGKGDTILDYQPEEEPEELPEEPVIIDSVLVDSTEEEPELEESNNENEDSDSEEEKDEAETEPVEVETTEEDEEVYEVVERKKTKKRIKEEEAEERRKEARRIKANEKKPFAKKKDKREIFGVRPSTDANLFICGDVIRRHGHQNGITKGMVGEVLDRLAEVEKKKRGKSTATEKHVRWNLGHAWHAINGFLNND